MRALRQHDILDNCLLHLFEIHGGRPFHYMLKLGCLNMDELDDATNRIGFTSVGNVRFEGATLVVARGRDQLPVLRRADVKDLSKRADLTSTMRAGERVFARLTPDQQEAFNSLDEVIQVAVVKSLAQLGAMLDDAAVNSETKARLNAAFSTFSRECVVNGVHPILTGAVGEVTTTVEGEMRRLLSRVVHAVYGRDAGRAQQELKLPTRVVRNLSLGKVLQAIRAASAHPDFQDVAFMFNDAWLDRIERFVNARNRWAHDTVGVDIDGVQLIDEAHHTIVEAIEIARWIETRLVTLRRTGPFTQQDDDQDNAPALTIAPPRDDPTPRIFISYSFTDGDIAERIARGLETYGLKAWYSGGAMEPGDSIVTHIESALAHSDTLLVLLSSRSVKSRWVRHEIDTGLMAQLGGRDVRVIPVIIDDCEVPEILSSVVHVDFRPNFEAGLVELVQFLRRRHRTGR